MLAKDIENQFFYYFQQHVFCTRQMQKMNLKSCEGNSHNQVYIERQ